MGAGVVLVDPQIDPRWDAYVAHHSMAGVWHSSPWLRVTERTYGYEPAHLAYESSGELLGVLPLVAVRSRLTGARLVSLPFSGPAGPIGSSTAVADALVRAAIELRASRGCACVILTAGETLPAAHALGLPTAQPYVCSVVPLEAGPERLWRDVLRGEVREEIRRARRRGVVIRIEDRRPDLGGFYHLYAQTSRSHGMPPQPRALFDTIREAFAPLDRLFLVEARVGERLVHAQLCVGFKDTLSVLYSGTDARFRRYHPVKLADWAGIELAWRRGYRRYDFLQSHVRNAGLRWYKRSFGAVEVPMTYFYSPRVSAANSLREFLIGGRSPLAALVTACARRAPLAWLEAVGRLGFRHVG